jgi:hypothetical protein
MPDSNPPQFEDATSFKNEG